ncbi:MAG: hypothetical protein HYZ44_13785 [Bacteroidetes bacterium]|nr:hypothetical protein [Bacteroidota bacterium]
MKELPFIILILLTFSCGQKRDRIPIDKSVTVSAKGDLNNVDLYEALQFVISDQQLDKRLGIKTTPISLSEHFLTERLIDTLDNSSIIEIKEGKLVLKDSFSISFHPPRVLTREDIDFMLNQQRILEDFYWDNSRLGFNTSNTKEWYEFSIPLFSRDSSKIVMQMYWTCDQFLCRHDTPILLTKDEGHWAADTGPVVLH